MADDQDRSAKTQEPTEKKLRDARKKGDVPSSKETGNMMVVVALFLAAAFVLPMQATQLVGVLGGIIDAAGRIPVGTQLPGLTSLGQVMREFTLGLVYAIGPFFLVLLAGAIFGILIQGQTVVAGERIKPKLEKISPRKGLQRLFSANSMVEFVKSLLKVLVVGALAVWVTNTAVRSMWAGPGFLPEDLPAYMSGAAQKLLIGTAAFLVPVAIADILWRRFDWRRKQMMSIKDIRDEIKESEGDPLIRAKRAQKRRQLSTQRVALAVPRATVILTNPTHYAIALKYDLETDVAPICVAKGADAMARRIREIAHEHEIPVIENKPLARALHEIVDVDDVVPTQHWQAIAEIIRFVLDLRKNPRKRPPTGSSLRFD